MPEPRQQQVRYWGWYSNAARGKRRKAEVGAEGPPAAAASADRDPWSRRRRLSWAQLIKKVYEIDPLLCRYCGAQMRVVAFVVEVSSLRRILEGMGLDPQEAEPLSRAPPVGGGARVRGCGGLKRGRVGSALAELRSVEVMGGRFGLREAPRAVDAALGRPILLRRALVGSLTPP